MQNVIRWQPGRRWGKWLGKSSRWTMRILAALGVSPVVAGLRAGFRVSSTVCMLPETNIPSLCTPWLTLCSCWAFMNHRATSLSAFVYACYVRHGIASSTAAVCSAVCSEADTLTPIRDIWRLLGGHLPYLRNCGDVPCLVQVISRSWVLLDKLVVPQRYVRNPRLHCCIDTCPPLVSYLSGETSPLCWYDHKYR